MGLGLPRALGGEGIGKLLGRDIFKLHQNLTEHFGGVTGLNRKGFLKLLQLNIFSGD